MFAGTALSVCLFVYAGLSLFTIYGPYLYVVVCVFYAYNLTLDRVARPLTDFNVFRHYIQFIDMNVNNFLLDLPAPSLAGCLLLVHHVGVENDLALLCKLVVNTRVGCAGVRVEIQRSGKALSIISDFLKLF